MAADSIGSSPRARGTLVADARRVLAHRFIPACAGNTVLVIAALGSSIGSSPRARGTLVADARRVHAHRFIPACAGNTSRLALRALDSKVHPRVRGEHLPDPPVHRYGEPVHPRVRGEHPRRIWKSRGDPGSSPRARGTLNAGWIVSPSSSVHPRVRGEHEKCREHCPWCARFIPACAGNTATGSWAREQAPVHPRVRGEH